MTHVRASVKKAVLATSLRAVGAQVGVSRTTVKRFVDGGDVGDKAAEKFRRWARGDPVVKQAQSEPPPATMMRQKAALWDAVVALVDASRATSADEAPPGLVEDAAGEAIEDSEGREDRRDTG